MTVVPIPAHALKSKTWYYGVRCACTRVHPICEDLFQGKTDETHIDGSDRLTVACPCGREIHANRLFKFENP